MKISQETLLFHETALRVVKGMTPEILTMVGRLTNGVIAAWEKWIEAKKKL